VKAAYFDCFSGASGDMILGALLDCGLDIAALEAELHKLGLSGWSLRAERQSRGPITGTKAIVEIATDAASGLCSLAAIDDAIAGSGLDGQVKSNALAVYTRLAAAEEQVHGRPADAIHLHEVAALDAVIDVVGACVGLHLLGVEHVFCSPLPLGAGSVSTAHGRLPVPAPATAALLALARAPVRAPADGDEERGEVLTPTGAAILTTLASFGQPAMSIERVGCGLGSRQFPGLPNALRLWLGTAEGEHRGQLLQIETNIDDMAPELYPYVMERMFALGALDVWLTPVQMKKGRPGVVLSALAREDVEPALVEILLSESSTLGVRSFPVSRHEAARETIEFTSSLGPAAVKLKRFAGRVSIAPEYEVCRRLAEQHGTPLQAVYEVLAREGAEVARQRSAE